MLHQASVSLNQCPAMSQARFNASASDAEARDCHLSKQTKPYTDWSVTCMYWDLCEKSKKNISLHPTTYFCDPRQLYTTQW